MKYHLSIPKMGESVQEATITSWLVQEGDIISKDQPYIEVSTDKVESEIPAPFHCRLLKILYSAQSTVKIDTPIAEIEVLEEGFVPPVNHTPDTTANVVVNSSPIDTDKPMRRSHSRATNADHQKMSPLVRRMIAQHQISNEQLQAIRPTGSDGRITKHDIDNYLRNRTYFDTLLTTTASQKSTETQTIKDDPKEPKLKEGDELVTYDRMRQLIANHLTESKRTSPHCTTIVEIDVTDLVKYRDSIKDTYLAQYGQKITYTHLMMMCTILALKQYKRLNAHSTSNGYIIKGDINLGFATALPDGNLIVPNVKKAQTLDLNQLVAAVNELASQAKNQTLKSDSIAEGTFTVSNTGIYGSLMGTPIINQPQVGIMSLGQIHKTPAVISTPKEDKIAIRHKMFASLSYDHRIIDGAYAASFLSEFKKHVENDYQLI